MLTAYNLNPDNDAVKSFFEGDNIWKILDIQRYEPSHSAFLVWFFNQKIAQYSHIRYLLNLLIHSADKAILSDGWNKTSDMKAFFYGLITESKEEILPCIFDSINVSLDWFLDLVFKGRKFEGGLRFNQNLPRYN